ncbi:Uncharacterised protein [Bordetella pertussis]|nr:Uncharacterised protein [Bordetella pertussis]
MMSCLTRAGAMPIGTGHQLAFAHHAQGQPEGRADQVVGQDQRDDDGQPAQHEKGRVRGQFQAAHLEHARHADAVGAAGDVVPFDQHGVDDHAQRQRRHGQVVAAQPEHQLAHRPCCRARQRRGEQHGQPWIHVPALRGDGRGVGAYAHEGGVSQRDLSAMPDQQRQADGRQRIDRTDDEQVDQIGVAGGVDRGQQGQREHQWKFLHRFTLSNSPNSPPGRTSRKASSRTNAMAFLNPELM